MAKTPPPTIDLNRLLFFTPADGWQDCPFEIRVRLGEGEDGTGEWGAREVQGSTLGPFGITVEDQPDALYSLTHLGSGHAICWGDREAVMEAAEDFLLVGEPELWWDLEWVQKQSRIILAYIKGRSRLRRGLGPSGPFRLKART